MQLTLSADEVRELRDLLDVTLADLRSEIHHTDTPEFRERLQLREQLLQRLREQLGAVDERV
jgi:hypothetical protein